MRKCTNCSRKIPISVILISNNKKYLTCPNCHTRLYKARSIRFFLVTFLEAIFVGTVLYWNPGGTVLSLILTALLLIPLLMFVDIFSIDYYLGS